MPVRGPSEGVVGVYGTEAIVQNNDDVNQTTLTLQIETTAKKMNLIYGEEYSCALRHGWGPKTWRCW